MLQPLDLPASTKKGVVDGGYFLSPKEGYETPRPIP